MSALQWTSLAQIITDTTTNAEPTTTDEDEGFPAAEPRIMPGIGVRFVSDEIKRDHRDLEILYKGLVQAVDEDDDKAARVLQSQFAWELARHLVAMQLFVFPGTEQRADEGNGKALRRRDDLAVIRDQLLSLMDLAPSDTEFCAVCERLDETMRQHIRDVERTDLVAIEKALDGEESERLARDWASAASFVPDVGEGEKRRRGRPEAPLPLPFATVSELLGASYEELRRAWEGLRKEWERMEEGASE